MNHPTRILYCNCTYAQVVPKEVKESVLKTLCQSGQPFETVADLCEMSARRDRSLQDLAAQGPLKIAACYPRAVKWLFNAAQAPLDPQATEVLNMRLETGPEISARLFTEVAPNLPAGKAGAAPAAGEPDPLT